MILRGAYGGLRRWPVHCQLRALKDAEPAEDLYPEDSFVKIVNMPQGRTINLSWSRGLTSTGKPGLGGYRFKNRVVPETSIPDEDDDEKLHDIGKTEAPPVEAGLIEIDVEDTGISAASRSNASAEPPSGPRIKHPPGSNIRDLFRLPPTVHEEARIYLAKNPDCKSFLNNLLKQLSLNTGVGLEGDINYYIDQLEKIGTMNIEYRNDETRGGGSILKPDYSTPGWGISFDYSVGTEPWRAVYNAQTYPGELVHAIGKRNGISEFSDDAAVGALSDLGLTLTKDEYRDLPIFASKVQIEGGTGIRYLPFGSSNLFHSSMGYFCNSKKSGKPFGVK